MCVTRTLKSQVATVNLNEGRAKRPPCGEEKEEKEQEKEELHEEDPETKCDDKDLKVYADLDQQLGKVFGEELGHEILKALVQFVCKNPLCLLTMGV